MSHRGRAWSRVDSAIYRLAPGFEVVQLGEDAALIRSEQATLRIDGPSVALFLSGLAPRLAEGCELATLAAELPGVDPGSLRRELDLLVERGVVIRGVEGPRPPHWVAMLPAPEGMPERLAALRVAVFGLEGHGAHLAELLCRSRVGTVRLVDPTACRDSHLPLLPPVPAGAVGRPLQEVVRAALEPLATATRLQTGGGAFSRDEVLAQADGCDMLVGCMDRGLSVVHQWMNLASLRGGVPAIYSDAGVRRWRVGPLVIPRETACHTCYRMRALACAEDFPLAAAYEDFTRRARRPVLDERGVLPAAMPYLAGLLGTEILKYLLGVGARSLAGRVLDFDPFTLRSRVERVLRRPDCPACRPAPRRSHPALAALSAERASRRDILRAKASIVGGRTGLVRSEPMRVAHPAEPDPPQVHVAEMAHYLRWDGQAHEGGLASGKGFTREESERSLLGEAIERYAGSAWHPDEVAVARRGDLEHALDPRSLVLYAEEQYGRVPFRPYREETEMGWVRGRSLVTGREIHIPALAVFLTYPHRSPEEMICPVTSSGLASGPTLLEAVLGAALEVIERDALMLAWLLRLECDAIDASSHPDEEVRRLVAAYARRAVDVRLFRLPADHALPVFAAIALQREGSEGPFATMGAAARLDAASAARAAILECAQVRMGLRARWPLASTRRRVEALAADPSRVSATLDHMYLYASREARGALGFLLDRPLSRADWSGRNGGDPAKQLAAIVERLGEQGRDVVYVNLTPPEIQRLGAYAARVVIPDFQPLHFGAGTARLGGTRLYETARLAGREPLVNPDPHPLG